MDSVEIEKFRALVQEFKDAEKPYWLDKFTIKMLTGLRFYSGAWFIYCATKGCISQSALQLLYRAVKECLKLYYSEGKFNNSLRETDNMSLIHKQECFSRFMQYGYTDAYNDFLSEEELYL